MMGASNRGEQARRLKSSFDTAIIWRLNGASRGVRAATSCDTDRLGLSGTGARLPALLRRRLRLHGRDLGAAVDRPHRPARPPRLGLAIAAAHALRAIAA